MFVVHSLKYLLQSREFRILYVVGLGRMILSYSNDVCPTWNKSSGLLSSELSAFPVAEWGLNDNGVAYVLQIKQSCNVNALFLADLLHLYVH